MGRAGRLTGWFLANLGIVAVVSLAALLADGALFEGDGGVGRAAFAWAFLVPYVLGGALVYLALLQLAARRSRVPARLLAVLLSPLIMVLFIPFWSGEDAPASAWFLLLSIPIVSGLLVRVPREGRSAVG